MRAFAYTSRRVIDLRALPWLKARCSMQVQAQGAVAGRSSGCPMEPAFGGVVLALAHLFIIGF